jgi:uncharacterized membrane protein YpjA
MVVEYPFWCCYKYTLWEIGWELALSNMQKEYLYVIICLVHELYVVTKACVKRYLQFCIVHREGKASRRWKAVRSQSWRMVWLCRLRIGLGRNFMYR